MTIREIAEAKGVSYQAIYMYMKKYQAKYGKFPTEEEMLKDRKNGRPIKIKLLKKD